MQGLKLVAEKVESPGEFAENHPSVAKATPILLALSARLKSCPDSLLLLQCVFPQAVKPANLSLCFLGSAEAVPLLQSRLAQSFCNRELNRVTCQRFLFTELLIPFPSALAPIERAFEVGDLFFLAWNEINAEDVEANVGSRFSWQAANVLAG